MKRRPLSLAARLAATYAGCAFALLATANFVLFRALEANFDREDDEFLSSQMAQLNRWSQHPQNAAPPVVPWGRVLSPAGRVQWESAGMGDLLPPSAFGSGALEIWRQNRLFRLRSETVNGRQIQIALDKSKDWALLQRYARQMLGVMLGGLLLSAGLGYFVARRGLAPVGVMAAQIHAVEAQKLHHRIGAHPWPPELAGLAASFDAMLDRLEYAFERLQRFSADLAHELRTPLANLRGEAEVALSRPRSEAELRAVLESSLEELARLSHMTEALLFLARAENGPAPLQKTALDARGQLETVAAYFEAQADEAGVTLCCQGETFSFAADAAWLRRALVNLVSNALRHTPRGGEVVLSAHKRKSEAVFTVRDTGEGIAPEHLGKVFDRFYRADAARLHAGTGAGLGLSIVRSIAELHGGRAELESEAGQGTSAHLVLPLGSP